MKKCKRCNKRIWWIIDKRIGEYHDKCAYLAWYAMETDLFNLEHNCFKNNTKPVTLKEYKQLKKEFQDLTKRLKEC